MVDALHVRRAGPRGLNARPRDGESIALLVEAFGQCQVLRVEMVLVARDIGGRRTLYLAGCVRELIPDGFTLAVFLPYSLNLEGSSGCAPEESFGKAGGADLRIGYCAGDLLL